MVLTLKSINKQASKNLEQTNDCFQLIQLGARPVVASAISGASNEDAIRLYRATNNCNAPRGLLPCDPDWINNSVVRRNEAVSFVALHKEAERNAPSTSRAAIMIAAWKFHRRRYPNSQLDFNRAWSLTRLVATGELIFSGCESCGTTKLSRQFEPLTERCHVCSPCRPITKLLKERVAQPMPRDC